MNNLLPFLKSKTFFANAILALVFFAVVAGFSQTLLKACTHHGEKIAVPELSGLTLDQAAEALEEAELEFRVIDSAEFNPDMPLGAILDQYPKPGALVKDGRAILLTINPYTVHKIELPKIVDKTLRRALYDLESKGFVVGKRIYKPDLGRDVVLGMVISGRPVKAGDKYVRGTVVDLVLGSGLSDERIPVPYLKWLTADMAREKLAQYNLNLGLVMYDPEVTDTLLARVYRQNPEANLDPILPVGTTIDIWLTNDSTKIPNDSLAFKSAIIDSTQINLEGPDEF